MPLTSVPPVQSLRMVQVIVSGAKVSSMKVPMQQILKVFLTEWLFLRPVK